MERKREKRKSLGRNYNFSFLNTLIPSISNKTAIIEFTINTPFNPIKL